MGGGVIYLTRWVSIIETLDPYALAATLTASPQNKLLVNDGIVINKDWKRLVKIGPRIDLWSIRLEQ